MKVKTARGNISEKIKKHQVRIFYVLIQHLLLAIDFSVNSHRRLKEIWLIHFLLLFEQVVKDRYLT